MTMDLTKPEYADALLAMAGFINLGEPLPILDSQTFTFTDPSTHTINRDSNNKVVLKRWKLDFGAANIQNLQLAFFYFMMRMKNIAIAPFDKYSKNVVAVYGVFPNPIAGTNFVTNGVATQVEHYTPPLGAPSDVQQFDFSTSNELGWINRIWFTKITGLPVGDHITKVGSKVHDIAGNIQFGIYDDVAGLPTNLIGQTNSEPITALGYEMHSLVAEIAVPANGIIWVGMQADDAAAGFYEDLINSSDVTFEAEYSTDNEVTYNNLFGISSRDSETEENTTGLSVATGGINVVTSIVFIRLTAYVRNDFEVFQIKELEEQMLMLFGEDATITEL